MSIAFGFHPLAVALALLLSAVLTWWVYRRTTPPVAATRRVLLMCLRWGALSILLLLLADPVVRTVERVTRTPIVAVLFDQSRSLSEPAHPGSDYSEQLKQTFDQVARAVGDAEIESFKFSTTVDSWSPTTDTVLFDGSRTDIAEALDIVRTRYAGRPLREVVLVSDGRYNTGRNPVYTAERFPVPIHTVLVGDTTSYKDVILDRVAMNEVGYVDRIVPVRVTLRAKGFRGRPVHITLSGSDIVGSDTTVVLPAEEAEISVDLTMIPSKEGFQRLEVAAGALDGERSEANNRVSFSMRVLRRKLSVLLIAAGPSPDVAALREMLEADPDLKVDAHTQKSSSSWYEGSPPPDFRNFDVVILAGYPGPQADTNILDAVVDSDRPVLFLLDRSTDLRLVREKLNPILPVTVETVRPGFVDANAVESPVGKTHPILKLSGTLDRLPPLSYSSSRWKASPDARTLATVSVRGIMLDDPLLVVRSRSGNRSAAILGAGIWRWRNVPTDLSDLDDVFPELVSNLLQWITTKSDDRPVRVRPASEVFDGGDDIAFAGEVYDESLDPISGASILLSVTDSAATTYDYRMESVGNGRYTRRLGRLPKGGYRYRAVAEWNGTTVGVDSGHFAVGELRMEFQDTEADADLMRAVARRSGGTFVHFGDLTQLTDPLGETAKFDSGPIEEEKQWPMRRYFPFLLVVVGLLSAEWIIRKRSGMV